LAQARLMSVKAMPVDWAAVDEALPTAKTPSGQARRRSLFEKMDNGNGLLSRSEVGGSLPQLVSQWVDCKTFRPAINCAFRAARDLAVAQGSKKKRRTADCMVDRTEFHALLVAFRLYLELDTVFTAIDSTRSMSISFKECQAAQELLTEWGLTEEKVRDKFPDDWTESMKYTEFAEWCIMHRMGALCLELDELDPEDTLMEEVGDKSTASILNAFYSWDVDGNGYITQDELASVLISLDPSFTHEQASVLLAKADGNQDGNIDYVEFAAWISQA